MPKRVSDYYYIFDGRSGRPVIVDRSSGTPAREAPSDVQPDCMPVAEHVLHQQGTAVIRAFACWCAQQTWTPNPPPEACAAPWHTARRVAATKASSQTLEKARSQSNEDAVLAAAVGMPRRRAEAAQLLAARSCTEPDVLAAAHDAMHMSTRWAEFTHSAPEADAAIRAMHEHHLNALLDALNGTAPFQQPDFLHG